MMKSIIAAAGGLLVCIALLSTAHANPVGPDVVFGSARFSQPDAKTLHIENSHGSIIHWNGFSIAEKEITRFIQPSSDSAVLNRVTGGAASEIFGSLISNGKLFLINPGGIVIGPDAVVDTAGFVASTLEMSNEDFLSGNYRFEAGGDAGDIVNKGYISAGKNGEVMLIAPNIENSGIITTDGGRMLLAAGRSITIASLDLSGVTFEVQAPENRVLNLGKLLAEKGAVGLFAGTLEHKGEIRADAISVDQNGVIVLSASGDATVSEGAVISADGAMGGEITVESGGTTRVEGELSAAGNTGTGGSVHVLGERVAMAGKARADVSGDRGGGEVLIGGDIRGRGDVRTAEKTFVGPEASITADAGTTGDGGKVIVWADDSTRLYGRISARGGEVSGNGGFVETSGKRYLDIGEHVPLLDAPNGSGGTWLIDPNDIYIVPGGGNTGIPAADPFASTDDSASLGVDLVVAALSGGASVAIITGTGGTNGETGNINLNTSLDLAGTTGTNTLSMIAHNNININTSITNSSAGGQVLNLVLTADSDTNGTGRINVGADIDTGGGSIDATGGFGIMEFIGNVTVDAGSLTASKININANTVTLNANTVVNDLGIQHGTLQGSGNITTASPGSFEFLSGTVTGTGTFTTNDASTLGTVGDVVFDGRDWTNFGVANWTDNTLTLKNNAVISNQPGAEFRVNSTGVASEDGAGGNAFANFGTFSVLTEAAQVFQIPFNNSGILDAGNDIAFLSPLQNGGNIVIAGGRTVTLGPGATHEFSGGSTIGGSLAVRGPLYVTDNIAVGSAVTVDNATVDIAAGKKMIVTNSFTMDGAAPVLNGPGSAEFHGPVDLNAGSMSGLSELVFFGLSNFRTGTISGAGTMETHFSTYIGGSGDVTVNMDWNNFGHAHWIGNDFIFTGTFTNEASIGAFEIASTGIMSGGTFENNGSLYKTTAGTSTVSAALNINAGSHFDIAGGTIVSSQSANRGAIFVQPGATYQPAAAFINHPGGFVIVDGTFNATTSLTNYGTVEGSGSISGDLLNYGDLFPGDFQGMLSVAGDYIQYGSGRLGILLNSGTFGTEYIALRVGGTSTLGGTLICALDGDFVPALGSAFDALWALAGISGNFAAIVSPQGYTISGAIDGSTAYRVTVAGPPAGISCGGAQEIIDGVEAPVTEPAVGPVAVDEPAAEETPAAPAAPTAPTEPTVPTAPATETATVTTEEIAEKIVETAQSTSADVVSLAGESEAAAGDPESVLPRVSDTGGSAGEGEQGEEEEKKKGQVVCDCD